MIILAIETSCDDTCVAVVEAKGKEKIQFKILSNIVSSQEKLHAKYGGVYPFLAKREHQKNLPVVFKKAIKKAGNPEIDLIGVTAGHGLEPCLWQGINFAKDLAEKLKKPMIPVNHVEAHILVSFIDGFTKSIKFPAICLVVSGGHTGLILMKGIGEYRLIGETRDDAAGECFDKAARILGLGYPGGPIIAKIAAQRVKGSRTSIVLPRPMIHQKNYDFSFSGLKTAVLYKARGEKYDKAAMCAEIQQAIIDVLIHKTMNAARDYGVKTIILGGGVVANDELRKQFHHQLKTKNYKLKLLVPPKVFCTDNAVMAAVAAFFHRSKSSKNIKAEADLRI
ncbi:MAG: tRNA (adenosine(37)-N6)-threonylcarbamoyltransferase complex transferase subunit TsaD [Candidatus Nealsonbacteria bacterium]